LEDFIVVCAAALYLPLERGAKSTTKYIKDLAQSGFMSRTPSPGEKGMGKGEERLYYCYFTSTRVDGDDVGSQNILGLQEKTIDLHCGGRKAPC
jgi:hypothetical protein